MVSEEWLSKQFEGIVQNSGFSIIFKSHNESPDFILSNKGRKIGAELKVGTSPKSLSIAIGQLLFGKVAFNLDDLWLVLPDVRNPLLSISKEWFSVMISCNIKLLSIQDNILVEMKNDMLKPSRRAKSINNYLNMLL